MSFPFQNSWPNQWLQPTPGSAFQFRCAVHRDDFSILAEKEYWKKDNVQNAPILLTSRSRSGLVPDQPEEALSLREDVGVRIRRAGDVRVSTRHRWRRLKGKRGVTPMEDDGAARNLRCQRDGC
jgi:hypothetical protein